MGQDLDDKYGMDLKRYKKIYFGDEAQYRIVYRIAGGGEIYVAVVTIGPRNDMEVYKTAAERIFADKSWHRKL